MSSPVQTPATYRQEGDSIDYTPGAAVTAGDVVVLHNRVYVALGDIPISTLGSIQSRGVFRMPKDASVFAFGDPIYWLAAGSPLSPGVASSGCATSTPTGATLAGYAVAAQLTGDLTVDCRLGTPGGADGAGALPGTTVAAAGSSQTDAAQLGLGGVLVTGANATVGVKLPVASAGTIIPLKNADAANAILKVYPSGTGIINALSASAAISMAAKTAAVFYNVDGTNWVTIPLVPS